MTHCQRVQQSFQSAADIPLSSNPSELVESITLVIFSSALFGQKTKRLEI